MLSITSLSLYHYYVIMSLWGISLLGMSLFGLSLLASTSPRCCLEIAAGSKTFRKSNPSSLSLEVRRRQFDRKPNLFGIITIKLFFR